MSPENYLMKILDNSEETKKLFFYTGNVFRQSFYLTELKQYESYITIFHGDLGYYIIGKPLNWCLENYTNEEYFQSKIKLGQFKSYNGDKFYACLETLKEEFEINFEYEIEDIKDSIFDCYDENEVIQKLGEIFDSDIASFVYNCCLVNTIQYESLVMSLQIANIILNAREKNT